MADLDRLRRIVTGHNAEGRSVVVIDGPPGAQIRAGAAGLFEIWNSEGPVVDSRSAEDRARGPVRLSPPARGSRFRWFAIAPSDPNLSRAELEKATAALFESIGAAHERVDTTRHPAMHKTETIDYIILLSGEVTLLLDEDERDLKPFDVVVQRGTNHAWVNKGTEPALLIAVLIDAEIR